MSLATLFPFIATWLSLPTLWAKLFFAGKFIFYRSASWSGTLYLYRKGKESGRKIYFVYATITYAASWLLVIYGTSWLIHVIKHLVRMRYPV